MTVFTLQPEGFSAVKKKLLYNGIFINGLILTTVLVLQIFISPDKRGAGNFLLFMLVFWVAILGYSMIRNVRRQKVIWNSYHLTFCEDSLVRKQEGVQTIVLPWKDITVIEQHPRGDFIVKTGNKDIFIAIPAAIESRDEVVGLLSQQRAILQQNAVPFTVRYRWFFLLLAVGSMLTFLTMNEPWIVVPLGLCIIGFMIYTIIVVQRSVQVDEKIKRSQYVSLFVIVLILTKMLAVLGVFGSLSTGH